MIEKDGKYYYTFKWQEGSITDWNNITADQCYKAGEILGRIHGINPHNTEAAVPEKSEIDFDAYIQKAEKINSSITDLLKDSLCYIDHIFDGTLSNVPAYELPKGYRFASYKQGDKSAWIDIELSSEEVLSKEHGEECWERYYKNREDELPGRMYFIENESGEKIATATAFYDIHGNDRPGEGQLHWVAIRKEYQGRGLSKPRISFVLDVMKSLGYRSVKIHTQTNTWLACKVYYDLGFRPEKDSLVKNRFGWKMAEHLTNRKMTV